MTQLSVKLENMEVVRQGLEDLGREVPKVGRMRIFKKMLAVRNRMRKAGEKIVYPVKWDSEKQRRAYFATDGFGRGIPTRRSGKYRAAWNIVPIESGYRVVNTMSYSKYVGGSARGDGQSRIHAGRWNVLRDVVEEETEKLSQEIDADIQMVARRKGF